jgi:hypothetical protein
MGEPSLLMKTVMGHACLSNISLDVFEAVSETELKKKMT